MKKKAFNTQTLLDAQKNKLGKAPISLSASKRGVQGNNLLEPLPNFIRRKSDKIIEGSNNASIVLGRDRPGEVGSGYGNQTGAGTIDIVVGRVSANIQTAADTNQSLNKPEILYVDNNISADASRIYISQKTNVDENFNLADGNVGSSKAKAAIAIKSDAVRIIGREGVKIISKSDKTNSGGAIIRSVPAIDIITGNNDTSKEPSVKGETTRKMIKDLIERINELNSILDQFMTYQMEFNSTIQDHTHPDPILMLIGALSSANPFAINNGECPFSPELLAAGIKANIFQQLSKHDGVMNKIKGALSEMTNTEVFGTKEPSSNRVSIT